MDIIQTGEGMSKKIIYSTTAICLTGQKGRGAKQD